MNNIIKFRRWLAAKIHPLDLADLTRTQLGPVREEIQLDLDGLNKEDREGILIFAENMWSNPYFRRITDPLVFAQIDHAVREAPDMRTVDFCRASINGIELVQEEFARLSSIYREKAKREVLFNKFDIV